MTPKEKAKDLIDIYKRQVSMTVKDYNLVCKVLDIDMAKQFSLIAVEELIIQQERYNNGTFYPSKYWNEVKQEIESL